MGRVVWGGALQDRRGVRGRGGFLMISAAVNQRKGETTNGMLKGTKEKRSKDFKKT